MLRTTTTLIATLATLGALAAPAWAAQDLRNPDQRAPVAVEPKQDLRSPDTVDAARGVTPSTVEAPAVESSLASASSGGFDWGDAGIGAAAMLGLVSLAGGMTLIATHSRRRRRFPAPSH